jgi:hypothetical protein
VERRGHRKYAAYLAMGVEELAEERDRPDGELAESNGVPIDAIRRGLPDALEAR